MGSVSGYPLTPGNCGTILNQCDTAGKRNCSHCVRLMHQSCACSPGSQDLRQGPLKLCSLAAGICVLVSGLARSGFLQVEELCKGELAHLRNSGNPVLSCWTASGIMSPFLGREKKRLYHLPWPKEESRLRSLNQAVLPKSVLFCFNENIIHL